MKIVAFIAFVIYALEIFKADKARRELRYADVIGHMGWAIIWYIAVTQWQTTGTRKDDAT